MSEPENIVETADVQTVAVTTPPPIANDQQPTADLGKVRELVLKAHPDVVPDLVAGSSVDELIASVEPARTAYQRIANQVRTTESGVGSRESEFTSPAATAVRPPISGAVAAVSIPARDRLF